MVQKIQVLLNHHRVITLGIFSLILLFACKPETAVVNVSTVPTATSLASTIEKDTASLKYIMGKFIPEKDSLFVKIPLGISDTEGRYMRVEAYRAYTEMYEAAKQAGILLTIKSATRNFDYQKGIWERKWTGETTLSNGKNASLAYTDPKVRAQTILEYSSMPSTSRHHWGTDIDLNNFNNSYFESGEGLKVFEWLEQHAHEYGFCRPYTAKDSLRPNGYNEEKWHWSYTPLSDKFTDIAAQHLKDNMIQGFLGSQVADELDVVENYVLGINHGCRH